MACETLFQQIEEKKPKLQKGEEYQVTTSMLEIYNEDVFGIVWKDAASISEEFSIFFNLKDCNKVYISYISR